MKPDDAATGNAAIRTVFRETRRRLARPLVLLAICATSLITGIAGPFGGYDVDPLPMRLLFWTLVITASALISTPILVTVETLLPRRPYWQVTLITGAVFSVFFLVFMLVLLRLSFPDGDLPHPLTIYVVILSVTLVAAGVIAALRQKGPRGGPTPAAPDPEPPTAPPPVLPAQSAPPIRDILDRIGPGGGTRLLRLAMADHYVEVYTDTGKHMVHMRFSDAVAELDPKLGGQVHRSHWVAWNQIQRAERDGHKRWFVLRDGTEVPIARSRLKELQDRGLV